MAKEIIGDLFTYWGKGYWTVITTNSCIRADGNAVMGRGVAAQAAKLCPELPKQLGANLRAEHGPKDGVYWYPDLNFITLPVKHHWYEKADPALVSLSLEGLSYLSTVSFNFGYVVLPRPGCGNGQLDWEKDGIREMVHQILDDRFTIVEKYP